MSYQSKLEELCRAFNEQFPVGSKVHYFPVARPFETPVEATVRHPAWVLSGHTAVAMLEEISGCVAISHIKPMQERAA